MHISTWGNTHTRAEKHRQENALLYCAEHPLTEGFREGEATAAQWTFSPQAFGQTPCLSFLPPVVTVKGIPICHQSHHCHLSVIPGQSLGTKSALEQWPVSAGSSSYSVRVPRLCSRLNMKLVLTRSALRFHSCTESQVVQSQNLQVLATGIPINADRSPPCLHLGALKAAKKPSCFVFEDEIYKREYIPHAQSFSVAFFFLKYLTLMLCPEPHLQPSLFSSAYPSETPNPSFLFSSEDEGEESCLCLFFGLIPSPSSFYSEREH